MILKYKVPKHYLKNYENKKYIYCEIKQTTEAVNKKVYLVKMLNFYNIANVFGDYELEKLNLLDKIKLLFIKKESKNGH